MATKFVIPTVFTDTSLPKFRIDPVLPDQGAMLLIDPMHPIESWAPGVPSNSSSVPNIVESQARSIVGGVASLDPVYSSSFSAEGTSGIHGFAERSTKGGLHACFTQRTEADILGNKGTKLAYPTVIADYIATTGRFDRYFISLWTKVTKTPVTGTQPHWTSQHGRASSITSGFGYALSDQHNPSMFNAGLGTSASSGSFTRFGTVIGALGDVRRGGDWEPLEENPYAGGAQSHVFTVGSYGTENSYLDARRASASQILHRFYLENLTISGRTASEVAALDLDLWTKDVATPGGRYYNDTAPTDPTTVP